MTDFRGHLSSIPTMTDASGCLRADSSYLNCMLGCQVFGELMFRARTRKAWTISWLRGIVNFENFLHSRERPCVNCSRVQETPDLGGFRSIKGRGRHLRERFGDDFPRAIERFVKVMASDHKRVYRSRRFRDADFAGECGRQFHRGNDSRGIEPAESERFGLHDLHQPSPTAIEWTCWP
jgi:hypothetical protein